MKSSWQRDRGLCAANENFVCAVKEWNTKVFGNIFHKKQRLLARLAGVQRALESLMSLCGENLSTR